MSVRMSQMGVSPPRLELPQPIAATLVDMEAAIVEISLVGCSVRHPSRVTVGSKVALQFVWQGKRARLDAKVARSTMQFSEGKAVFVTGLQFADSVDAAPEVVRSIVKSLIPEEKPAPVPEPHEKKSESGAARFSTPPENSEPKPAAPPPRATVGGLKPAAPPAPKGAPKRAATPPQPLTYSESVPFLRFDDEFDEVAPALELEPEPEAVPEAEPLFLRCRLIDGRWHDEHVSEPSQPDDGFTVLADTGDLDGLRRTYEVADPETRRMMRFSFEIEIEQQARA